MNKAFWTPLALLVLDMTCLNSTFTFLSNLKLFDSFKLHSWKMDLQMLTQDYCADEIFPARETICQLHLDLSIKHWFNALKSKNMRNTLKWAKLWFCVTFILDFCSKLVWIVFVFSSWEENIRTLLCFERVQILSNRIFFDNLLKTSKIRLWICLSVYLFIFH